MPKGYLKHYKFSSKSILKTKNRNWMIKIMIIIKWQNEYNELDLFL